MYSQKKNIENLIDKSLRSCFVLMPFKEPFNSYYEQIIKPAVLNTGMDCLRADEIYDISSLMHDILNQIKEADIIIAELTSRNPNVLYELGIAHAMDKPVLILSQTMDDIPSDLRHWRIQLYNTIEADWTPKLKLNIQRVLKNVSLRKNHLKKPKRKISAIEYQLEQTNQQLLKNLPIVNPFADRLAAWRLNRATSISNEIFSGRIPFTAMNYAKYIGYIFSAIMRKMEVNETYYTISNIEFWSENGVNDSTFLIENMNAAERGVKLKRIIFVSYYELEQVRSRQPSTSLKVLSKHFIESSKNIKTQRNVSISILPVDNLAKAIGEYSHFGLLVDTIDENAENGNALLVSPNLQSRTLLQGINLLFSSGPCKDQYECHNALRNFRELMKSPEIMDIKDLFNDVN